MNYLLFSLWVHNQITMVFINCRTMNIETQSLNFFSDRNDITDEVSKCKILTEEEIQIAVKKCADAINDTFKGKRIIIVCIFKGAAYFFVDLTRQIKIPYSTYFIEASSYHNSQTQSECINILSSIEPSKFVNRHVYSFWMNYLIMVIHWHPLNQLYKKKQIYQEK